MLSSSWMGILADVLGYFLSRAFDEPQLLPNISHQGHSSYVYTISHLVSYGCYQLVSPISLWQSLECNDPYLQMSNLHIKSQTRPIQYEDTGHANNTRYAKLSKSIIQTIHFRVLISNWRKSSILEKQKTRCSSSIKCKGKISSNSTVYICVYMDKETF